MDYIEKAVKKLGNAAVNMEFAENPPLSSRDADITYTQTRVFTPDQDILRKNGILTADTPAEVIDAYKVLRTRTLQRMQQNNWRTLALTSCRPNEGKTVTAINLSISLARKLEYTVLLVDLDYRKPSIHSAFGLKPQASLSDYFMNDAPLSEIMVNIAGERLVVLPQDEGTATDMSEHITSDRMAGLVSELRDRYPRRIVIFDMSPVMIGDDVLGFATHTDALLLVVEEGSTSTDELQQVNELLAETNWIGTVLNKSRYAMSQKKYGYYYR